MFTFRQYLKIMIAILLHRAGFISRKSHHLYSIRFRGISWSLYHVMSTMEDKDISRHNKTHQGQQKSLKESLIRKNPKQLVIYPPSFVNLAHVHYCLIVNKGKTMIICLGSFMNYWLYESAC